MRVLLCCLLANAGLWCASAASVSSPAPVTVVLDFEKPPSEAPLQAMREQVQHVLNGAGLAVDLRLRSEVAPAAEFSDVMLFKMKGSCTMNALPLEALSDERGPLAMAYSTDGEILHFGEVQCDRVRQALQRVVGKGDPGKYQSVFGRALGLVLAHEMYHIMANAKTHTKDGVTKPSLSGRELLAGDLTLSRFAQEAMKETKSTEREQNLAVQSPR